MLIFLLKQNYDIFKKGHLIYFDYALILKIILPLIITLIKANIVIKYTITTLPMKYLTPEKTSFRDNIDTTRLTSDSKV